MISHTHTQKRKEKKTCINLHMKHDKSKLPIKITKYASRLGFFYKLIYLFDEIWQQKYSI